MAGKARADGKDAPAAGEVAFRVFAATAGAYALAYALTAALAGVLFRVLGTDRVDAAIISSGTALLALPAASVWAFAERRPVRLAGLMTAAVAVLAAIAWALRP